VTHYLDNIRIEKNVNMEDLYIGERVYLKLLSEHEIDERYLSWFKSKELVQYYSSTKREFTREYLVQDLRAGLKNETHYVYGIYTVSEGLLIGNVKIGPIMKSNRNTDFSIILGDRSYYGKGIAQEAFKLGNHLVFMVYDLRKITSGMFEANRSSFKALKKSGWVIEGRRKGHYFVDGNALDQILVSCFNPRYFPVEEIEKEFPDDDYM
jgi:[ribosomal protein S5]-alanine N-acetyltransferase